MIPTGTTRFLNGDQVMLVGRRETIEATLGLFADERPHSGPEDQEPPQE